jgi:hypothetical protein
LIVDVLKLQYTKLIKIKKKRSLILLKNIALVLDFTVPRLVFQKFIKKKEDNPIDSQPKNNKTKLLEVTSISILIINHTINNKKLSPLLSNLK